jgi:hypothetical protein
MAINIVGMSSPSPKELYFTVEEVVEHVKKMLQSTNFLGGWDKEIPYVKNVMDLADLLMRNGQKIQAIRLVRNCFPVGLKEAKDFVEANFLMGWGK